MHIKELKDLIVELKDKLPEDSKLKQLLDKIGEQIKEKEGQSEFIEQLKKYITDIKALKAEYQSAKDKLKDGNKEEVKEKIKEVLEDYQKKAEEKTKEINDKLKNDLKDSKLNEAVKPYSELLDQFQQNIKTLFQTETEPKLNKLKELLSDPEKLKSTLESDLKELNYGKSSRFYFNGISKSESVLFYELIPHNDSAEEYIDVNLQLYNYLKISADNTFKVEVLFVTKNDIREILKDGKYINTLPDKTEGELNPLISATNMHVKYNVTNNKEYILIIFTSNFDCSKTPLILETTISKVNSLIYPSERIYHYGEIGTFDRITYRLKGYEKYVINPNKMNYDYGRNYNANINLNLKLYLKIEFKSSSI